MKTKLAATDFRVKMMTEAYGSIDAAREAYRSAVKSLSTDSVLMVSGNGRIAAVASCEVFYRGSPDARFVLPS